MPNSVVPVPVDANSETCSPAIARQRWGGIGGRDDPLVRDDLHRSFRSSAWSCASPFNRFAGENRCAGNDAPERYQGNSTSAKVTLSRFKSSLREDINVDAAPAARSRSATRSRPVGIAKANYSIAHSPARPTARPKSASKKRPPWQSQAFLADISRVHVSQRSKVLQITKDGSDYGAV